MEKATVAALPISAVGALVDFISGYELETGMGGGMVGGYSAALGVGLFALGAVVLLVGVSSARGAMPRYSGFGMELGGLLMVFASAYVPGMGLLTSFAMLTVGGLMLIDGALMQRRSGGQPRV